MFRHLRLLNLFNLIEKPVNDQGYKTTLAWQVASGQQEPVFDALQLRHDTTSMPGITRILADTNGDRAGDMEIQLTGTFNLTAADFLL